MRTKQCLRAVSRTDGVDGACQVTLSKIYRGSVQLDLFGVTQRQRDLTRTIDAIRTRYGPQALLRSHDRVLAGKN